jgi:small subunit ribosomal protein S20
MPNLSAGKKALRQNDRRRRKNYRRKLAIKGATKEALASPSSQSVASAYKAIDKAAKTGLLKKKAAARKKSRLAKSIARNTK